MVGRAGRIVLLPYADRHARIHLAEDGMASTLMEPAVIDTRSPIIALGVGRRFAAPGPASAVVSRA